MKSCSALIAMAVFAASISRTAFGWCNPTALVYQGKNGIISPQTLSALQMENVENDLRYDSEKNMYRKPAGVVQMGCSGGGSDALYNVWKYPETSVAALPLHLGQINDSHRPTWTWQIDMEGIPDNITSQSLHMNESSWEEVPMLIICGERDNLSGNCQQKKILEVGRANHAVWAYVIDPGQGHCHHSDACIAFANNWLREVAAYRMPQNAGCDSVGNNKYDETQGWLGELEVAHNGVYCADGAGGCENYSVVAASISPYGSYKGDPSLCSWLPTQALAIEWYELNTGKKWDGHATGVASANQRRIAERQKVQMEIVLSGCNNQSLKGCYTVHGRAAVNSGRKPYRGIVVAPRK